MNHVPSVRFKMFSILLVVIMLAVTMGVSVASASTVAMPDDKTAGLDHGMPALCNYTVRPGDTLYGIARRFGTSVWHLANINHIANINLIRSGRHIYVPCGGWDGGHKPPPPPGCTYRVKFGDSLSKIAVHFGTSTGYLASVNHIANPNRIYAGQWLRVPCYH